jgi:hypothetical protein
MLRALLSVLFTAALSAFVPVTPVEPYLVVLAATGDLPPVALSVTAAAGQTAGKLLIFLATRAALRSGRLHRFTARLAGRYSRTAARAPNAPTGRRPGAVRRRLRSAGRTLMALLDRPTLVAPTVLLSAVTGLPPLLAVSVHAARTAIPATVFALCCLTGRTLRFLALTVTPDLLSLGQ